MIGHLGSRASALLDGQLPPAEAERAWEHVLGCHACRDLVEREGWIKTRLAGLQYDASATSAPDGLKGALIGASVAGPPGDALLTMAPDHRRRNVGLAAIGGGAVGAAMMGVLVFGVAPADAPTIDRRAPATSITPTETPRPTAPTQTVATHLARGKQHHR